MKASFEQNEFALKQLLATGNATLTHKKGGEWRELMPELLMEVRGELRRTHTNNSVQLSEEEQKETEESIQDRESTEQKINRLFDEIASVNLSEKERSEQKQSGRVCLKSETNIKI